ncbi:MAG TPA: imidazole glycerol phosphate synthase subunit HisH [Nitrososphaerales archaeon]
MPKIGIIDYGAGNLFSLKKGLEQCNAEVEIIERFSKKTSLNGVILPGVGNFGSAVKKLEKSREELVKIIKNGLPYLGICLGAQLIFEKSEEDKGFGLSLLEGEVVRLPSSVKVPHMGWNTLEITRNNELLNDIEDGSWVYFVHSYYPKVKDSTAIAVFTDYGVKVPSVIAKNNVFGTQFHPEKSGPVGLRILRNFIDICRR